MEELSPEIVAKIMAEATKNGNTFTMSQLNAAAMKAMGVATPTSIFLDGLVNSKIDSFHDFTEELIKGAVDPTKMTDGVED